VDCGATDSRATGDAADGDFGVLAAHLSEGLLDAGCRGVGALARVVKDKARRDVLLTTESADEFVELLREGSLAL